MTEAAVEKSEKTSRAQRASGEGVLWVLVLVVSIAMVYVWMVLFHTSLRHIPGQAGANDLWKKSSWMQPMAHTPAAAPAPNKTAAPRPVMVQPDAISGATPRVIAFQVRNVVETVRPAVVGICVGAPGQRPPWTQGWQDFAPAGGWSVGSGIVVHPDGYILTNHHVVASNGELTVSLFSRGGSQDFPARIVKELPKEDLALLKIDAGGPLLSAPLGDSNDVRVGDQVVGIGNPFGFTSSVTKGIVSARRKLLTVGNTPMRNLIQTDVPINPGNSGGALANMRGELIGINVAIYSPLESVYSGVSFAIPINRAKALFGKYMDATVRPMSFQWTADRALSRGSAASGAVGAAANGGAMAQTAAAGRPGHFRIPTVRGTPANPSRIPAKKKIMPSPGEGIEELAWLGIDFVPEGDGVEVDEVEGITPMEAGLQAGDVLKHINGRPIPDMYALKDAIKEIPLKKGTGILFDVFRPKVNREVYISFRLKDFDIKGR